MINNCENNHSQYTTRLVGEEAGRGGGELLKQLILRFSAGRVQL